MSSPAEPEKPLDSRELIREEYNRSGEGYDDVRYRTSRGLYLTEYDIGLFHRLLPEPEQGRILEVGAGTGRFTVEALNRGYSLVATDVNDVMLESLRAKLDAGGLGDRCEVRQENIFELSFDDASFDFVFCLHCVPRFMNFSDQRAAILELGRVVRPGGRLLFNFRNARSPYRLAYRGPAARPQDVADTLASAGLEIEERRSKHVLNGTLLDHTPRMLWRLFAAADRALEQVLPDIGWDVFVLARKRNAP